MASPSSTRKFLPFLPGSIGLERASYANGKTPSMVSQLIMAGERSRYGSGPYSLWSHSFIIISEDGHLIEANQDGIEEKHISEYEDRDVIIVETNASPEQRALAVAFCKRQLGIEYGVTDFFSLALQAIFGWNLSFSINQQMICSELCARATEKYIPAYDLPSQSMMPADLAHYWGVLDKEKPPPLGWFGKLLNLLLIPRELLRSKKWASRR